MKKQQKDIQSIFDLSISDRIVLALECVSEYPARLVCNALNLPRTTYYAYKRNGRPVRILDTEEDIANVVAVFNESNGKMGRRRICKELRAKGITMCEKKISRILTNCGLRAKKSRPLKSI